MRKVHHISPSSLFLWMKNPSDYYLRYFCPTPPPRDKQTAPMSIGSAFDAYVKSYLYEALFGKNHDPKFNTLTLFETQVESQNRDWAWEHGAHAFKLYQDSGALADLLIELNQSIGSPKFEFSITGVVNGYREGFTKNISGIVFNGKPDIFYINKEGCKVEFDWKVNGWCSKYNISPKPGYLRVRETIMKRIGVHHKDCTPMLHRGMMINGASKLEDIDSEWAIQLSIYSWLAGNDVGEDFIGAIDQLVCKQRPEYKFPEVRVAEHRLRVGKEFQWNTYAKAQELWDVITNGHIFRDMTPEESEARCKMLDKQNEIYSSNNEEDRLFNQISRS